MTHERGRGPRILMTADTVGGVWTYAVELSRGLAAEGVQVWLAAMGGPASPEQQRQAQALENLTLLQSDYALEWMQDPWADVDAAGEWLLSLEREIGADVVHVNGYAHGALPFAAPVVVVGHSCVGSWWQAVKGEPAPSDWDEYRRRVAAGIHAADSFVAPTAAILRAITRAHGLPERGQVIPNGLPIGAPPVTGKQPLVLSAGRLWDEAKNVSALAACADAVPWPIHIAGPTAHPQGAPVHTGSLQVLGHLAPGELRRWMERASIYALPARYEPFGLSVLEAALAGCALVLGDIDSLRELWDGAALFVPPDDPAQLGAALGTLASDGAQRARLASRARERATCFDVARMAASYRQLYHQLCQCGGVQPSDSVEVRP